MKISITKERFENILFDVSRSITERKSVIRKKKLIKVELREGRKLVAVKEIIPGSVKFYEVV